jgi:aryl-alcohol dehydrogenase-like predicted oxidoreductase
MRMQTLGSQGPQLSVIGFGAWEAGGADWGPNESEAAVVAAVHAGLDAGINWIDTAEVYGKGTSEELIGHAVAGRRDDVLIATKVAPIEEGSGLRPEQIRTACDASLGRLGIDHIDLYQIHWPDETGVPIEESWATIAELVDAGKVRHIGVSNFDRALIERCEAIRHVDSLQQEFSMVVLDDRELIRWCGEVGTGVVSYSPLGAGLLTDALTREQANAFDDWRGGWKEGPFSPEGLDRAFRVLERIRPVAVRLGVSPAQLALAWNRHQPGVTSAIAGSRNPAHVRDNAAAGDLELDTDTLAELDAVLKAASSG